ncbi:MAG: CoA pyrophosphatase [Pseudomonadota bacterium]
MWLPKRGESELRDAAVLVPFLGGGDDISLLLTQRAAHLKHHAGQVSFPGGRCEPDDADAVAAALRETYEEVGIDAAAVTVLGTLAPRGTITGFRVTPVVAWLDELPPLQLQEEEVMAAFDVPLGYLADERNQNFRSRDIGTRRLRMVEWEYSGYRIWGATAMMIHEVLGLLKTRERD